MDRYSESGNSSVSVGLVLSAGCLCPYVVHDNFVDTDGNSTLAEEGP